MSTAMTIKKDRVRGVPDNFFTAIRRGEIYCAPFCGGRCTWAAFEVATARAEGLAKQLGAGWVPVVWENLGWHAKVIGLGGRLHVHVNVNHRSDGVDHDRPPIEGYTAFLNPAPEASGGKWSAHGVTPEGGIRAVALRFHADYQELKQLSEPFADLDAALLGRLQDPPPPTTKVRAPARKRGRR
jgi:hypothetical protein